MILKVEDNRVSFPGKESIASIIGYFEPECANDSDVSPLRYDVYRRISVISGIELRVGWLIC
ncbi:MAG: hypothetical protein AAGJ83_00350 [Planctomycetota bacterium]